MLRRFQEAINIIPSSFNLAEIEDFPVDIYEENESQYIEYENWYDGTSLEVIETQNGQQVELYPVPINPIRGSVMKHATVLFGDIVDDGRPLVVPRIVQKDAEKASKKMAEAAKEVLNVLWYENHGRAIQLRNVILSQYLGGCIFKLTYVPEETWRSIPIRIELIHPRNFIGIADASDYWRLRQGWIVRLITKELAKEYGLAVDNDFAYYIEDWRPHYYRVLIDGKVASRAIPGTSERRDMAGVNPFGVVPMVYIPHIRTKGFYGESMIDGLEGIVKEINLRAGDYGDAVSDDAHVWLAMRNVNGTSRTIEVAPGLKVLDLKSSPSVTGNESQPDIFPLKQAMASDAMGKLWDRLYDQFLRDVS